MANTHQVLEGVKEYTRDLIGVAFRDVAVDAASRAEGYAIRAEAAADNAEVGIRDDTVAKNHLTSGLRSEIDGKASTVYVDGEVAKKSDTGHKHVTADITDAVSAPALIAGRENKLVRTGSDGMLHSSSDPAVSNHLTRKSYVDAEVGKKANADHKHTAAQVGARPVTWTPTAAEVGAATPAYVDSRPAMWLWDGTGTWTAPPGAVVGDTVLNTDTGDIWSLKEV